MQNLSGQLMARYVIILPKEDSDTDEYSAWRRNSAEGDGNNSSYNRQI